MKKTEITITQPITLIEALQQAFPSTSRTTVKEMLAHSVMVDDRRITRHDHQLVVGQVVTVTRETPAERHRLHGAEIVYEDRYLLVVNKKSGLLTNSPDPRDQTLIAELNRMAEGRGQRWHAHVVHRLDRDTSGLLIVAKSKDVARQFEENWKERVNDRAYVALVWGHLEPPQGTHTSYLSDGPFSVVSTPTDPGGAKLAVTHYRTLSTSRRYSLVEFRLDTGRRNQIRVHARDLGHPVVHDPMYGYKDDVSPIARLALHACRLGFTHPVTGRTLSFSTPVPQEFNRLIAAT
ncbi:MAG: RluA family pseudouridine synthase [Bacteroidales bacterium]|nr:RluA family pseudouridine synthase [Bacteroidales bacterium]